MEKMGALKNTRPDLLPEGSLRKRELIMMRHLLLRLDTLPSDRSLLLLRLWVEIASNGCQDCLSQWYIEEEVYIEQPEGFVIHGKESHVCKLKKALYGLKQVPCAWYGWIDGFLVSLGFTKSDADPNIYYKVVSDEPLILVIYVDDLFLTRNEKLILWCKNKLTSDFEM